MTLPAVERAIQSALAATRLATEPAGGAAADLLDQLEAVASGGKRLRAQLLLASHAAHGGLAEGAVGRESAVNVAAAIELFQTAALVHDDVLDAAQTRRGRPTIHRALAAQHQDRGWTGDAEHFGTSGAILAGDLALMASHRALGRGAALANPHASDTVMALFLDMADLCTAGQFLDMELAARPLDEVAEQGDQILAVMRSKTASYTAEFPLALGAACADASADQIAAMRAVGVPLGIAFQLRDDVLGLVGRPEVTGKPSGDDVREGKRTQLIAYAWAHGDAHTRAILASTVGNSGASPAQLADAVAAIEETGAVIEAEVHIANYTREASSALASAEQALADGDGRLELERLIAATTSRLA